MVVTWDPNNKDASISLSGGNMVATSSAGSWRTVIATAPARSAARVYFRGRMNYNTGTDFAGVGFCAATESTATLIGADALGWLAYTEFGNAGSIYHVGGAVGSVPALVSNGDYIVCAYDGIIGAFYATTMTAAGVLNQNWNTSNANPAAGVGGLSVPVGALLLPGASFLATTDSATLDAVTVIFDQTLVGFSPFGHGAVKSVSSGVVYAVFDANSNEITLSNGQPQLTRPLQPGVAGNPTALLSIAGESLRLTQANASRWPYLGGQSFVDADGNVVSFIAPPPIYSGGSLQSSNSSGVRMQFKGLTCDLTPGNLNDLSTPLAAFASGGVIS